MVYRIKAVLRLLDRRNISMHLLEMGFPEENANRAVELGLAEADWYQCPVSRATMRKLLARRNGPATRDTIIWLSLIIDIVTQCWRLFSGLSRAPIT